MRTIPLEVHFNRDLRPGRVQDAREVFRRDVEELLRSTGPGPDGAWGYGSAYVCGVTLGTDAPGALDLLRRLHRFLRPELYPESERPPGASSQWSPDTLDSVASMIADALAGDPFTRFDPGSIDRVEG